MTQATLICDRCNRLLEKDQCDGEWDEHLAIAFHGGYFSVFGDGSLVECCLCQHCVKDLLAPFLRVRDDDPLEPVLKPTASAKGARQPYQSSMSLKELFEKLDRKSKK